MAKSMIGLFTMRRGKVVFVDTSALFAVANAKDKDHQKAKDFLIRLAQK